MKPVPNDMDMSFDLRFIKILYCRLSFSFKTFDFVCPPANENISYLQNNWPICLYNEIGNIKTIDDILKF